MCTDRRPARSPMRLPIVASLVAFLASGSVAVVARSAFAQASVASRDPASVATVTKRSTSMPGSPTLVTTSLDDALAFSDPAQCVAGPTLEDVYSDLDAISYPPSGGGELKMPGLPVPLVVSTSSRVDGRRVRIIRASARPSRPASWHSLRVAAISIVTRRAREPDGTYPRAIAFTRAIEFQESPAELLRIVNRLGFRTKAASGFTELTAERDNCRGAMSVTAVPGGAALRCEWSC